MSDSFKMVASAMKKISHENGMENDSRVISKGFTEEVIFDQKPQ